MAYELQTILLVPLLGVLILILRWIHRRRKIFRIFQAYGIPGPEPSLFTGNMHQLKAGPSPIDVMSQWLEQYGNVFGYFIGEIPHLVVKDLSFLKQVMIKDFSQFTNRAEMLLDLKPLTNSLVCLEGQRWKEVRSLLSPSFSSSKMKLMTPIMEQKVSTMVEAVKRKAFTGEVFDIYEIVQSLTLDVIADCAFAMKVNCVGNLQDPFLLVVKQFFLHAQNKIVEYAIIFPFLSRIMVFVANYLTVGKMNTMIVENVKKVIDERRETSQDMRRVDMLQFMLDAAENRDSTVNDVSSRNKKSVLTDDDIIANAYAFLLGGYETTSTALAFTFHFLAQHPEVQEKLYDEIISNSKTDQSPYEAIQSLQYLDQVFNESLRLYPPLAGFLTRKCQKEYNFDDVVVPEGTIIHVPVWDIHHDPELWPDPWKFDPDRFAPENRDAINSMSFLPFGAGPRICVGMRFSQLEAKLTVSRLVREFRFEPCEKTEDPVILRKPCPTITINPANGVHLKALPRNSIMTYVSAFL